MNALTATVRRLWDGAADVYDEAIVPALSDAHHQLLRVLDPAPGERVLDLGCGTGRMSELVAQAGARRSPPRWTWHPRWWPGRAGGWAPMGSTCTRWTPRP